MGAYSDAIHAALLARATGAQFPRVSYHPVTGARTTSTTDFLPPKVLASEVSESYDEAALNRRPGTSTRKRERAQWSWLYTLKFDKEVSLESFEKDLLENPPRIVRDPGSGLDHQVDLFLAEKQQVTHPPRQQSASGTVVTYRVVAVFSPL